VVNVTSLDRICNEVNLYTLSVFKAYVDSLSVVFCVGGCPPDVETHPNEESAGAWEIYREVTIFIPQL